MTTFEKWNEGKIANFGSFHTTLLTAYRLADLHNRERLEQAFPEWFMELYVIVQHSCYMTDTEGGYRVYHEDDPYLNENPSMYRRVSSHYGKVNTADHISMLEDEYNRYYEDINECPCDQF